jgi:hypothetical protein
MAEEKKLHSSSAKEIEKAKEQFDQFDQSVKDLTLDRMNMAPKLETEPQVKLSSKELQIGADKVHYLKPIHSISCPQKFNENFRDEYNYRKQYVPFIAEHNELKGENIEIWTRPYGGMPAEEWRVPTNKVVWGPRYLAEQIKKKSYHRLIMQENIAREQTGLGVMYGQMAVDTTINRLDARPVNQNRKSIFIGADGT